MLDLVEVVPPASEADVKCEGSVHVLSSLGHRAAPSPRSSLLILGLPLVLSSPSRLFTPLTPSCPQRS